MLQQCHLSAIWRASSVHFDRAGRNGQSLRAKWRSGDTAEASFNGRERQGGMSTSFDTPTARKAFDRLLAELRPKLHRYCARMTGSVIDGEDLVQEALLKVIEALDQTGALANPEAWVFRIAHNAALDFLRRRTRQQAIRSDEDPDMIAD